MRPIRRGFSLLEVLVTIAFTAAMIGPILSAFQTGERLSRRSERAFAAQTIARSLLDEISSRPFSDPDGADTHAVSLLPGPTHEEYRADAPTLANGTDEVTGQARFVNETLLDRRRFYDDLDDYDGYNADGSIVPTDERGREPLVNGANPWAGFRAKVRVTSDASSTSPPMPVSDTLGPDPTCLAITPEGDYALVAHAGDSSAPQHLRIINLRTGLEVDACPTAGTGWADTPGTGGLDRISLQHLSSVETWPERFRMGPPTKILPGPGGDRFHVIHTAGPLDFDPVSGEAIRSGATTVDLNRNETPEVSFKKQLDASLVARGLYGKYITAVAADADGRVYVAALSAGLARSDDRGETWTPVRLERVDGKSEAEVACLAVARTRDAAGASVATVYAGGSGGLWRSTAGGPFQRLTGAGTKSFRAVAASDGGIVAAGDDAGAVLQSRDGGATWTETTLPGGQAKALAIDTAGRIFAGSYSGLFVDEGIREAAIPVWSELSATPANTLFIDRSRTHPAPWTKVLARAGASTASLPFCPSLHATPAGLHLFYLDDLDSGSANGTTPGAFRLWYVNSPDFGRTWLDPVQVSKTPAGILDWAHSELVDERGALHVTWLSNRSGGWRVFYQRSDDGGRTWLATDIDLEPASGGVTFAIDPLNADLTTNDKWKYGADRYRLLAWSPDNRLAASLPSTDAYHHFLISPDGGRTWPADGARAFPKSAVDERLEAIDFHAATNRFSLVVSGGGGHRSLLAWDGESSTATRIADFPAPRTDGAAPVTDPDGGLVDFFVGSNAAGTPALHRAASRPPHARVDGSTTATGSVAFDPVAAFRPAALPDGVTYAFFTIPGGTAPMATAPRFAAARFADGRPDSGRILLDLACGDVDSLTSCVRGDRVFFLKRDPAPSPAAGFRLSEFPAELLVAGMSGSATLLAAGDAYSGAMSTQVLTGSVGSISCLAGNADSLWYGSSSFSGLLRRPGRRPVPGAAVADAASFRTPGYESSVSSHAATLGFLPVTCPGKPSALFAEEDGTLWVGTDTGLLRSEDGGATLVRVGFSPAHAVDAFAPGSGSAASLERLLLVSSRPIGSGSPPPVERLVSRYRLDAGLLDTVEVAGGQLICPSYDGRAVYRYSKGGTGIKSLFFPPGTTPPTANLTSSIPGDVDRLVAAPDGKTLYAIDPVAKRVHAIADVTRPAAIAVTSFPVNPHALLTAPRDVIFSPKSASGAFKTFIVWDRTITDLSGTPLFSGTFDIAGACVTDGDEIYFLDRATRRIHRVVRANVKTVIVSVEDSPDVVSTMPPVTLAKKFFKGGDSGATGGLSPIRERVRYEYVYTSRDCPAGVKADTTALWSRRDTTTPIDPLLARVYVVDSVLAIDGTLEIAAGTVVKFATDDKRTLPTMGPSGYASAACLLVGKNGRLVVAGGTLPADRVVFTSLDDPACAPSVWNGRDGDFRTTAGLPNIQPYRLDASGAGFGGPRFGDWGHAGGPTHPSYNGAALAGQAGGILLFSSDNALLTGLDLRYGLLSTGGLYPGGVSGAGAAARWTRTNTWLVDAGGFTVERGGALRIDQGAIVRIDGSKGIRFLGIPVSPPPGYDLAAFGSPARPVRFRRAAMDAESIVSGVTGMNEPVERTPRTGTSYGEHPALFAEGEGTRAIVSRAHFPDAAAMVLPNFASRLRLLDCVFGEPSDAPGPSARAMRSAFAFSGGDATSFERCLFSLANRGTFDLRSTSAVSFRDCTFLSFSEGTVKTLPFFRVAAESSLRLVDCLLDHKAGDLSASRVLIEAGAEAVLRGNLFRNGGAGNRVSCEVEIAGEAVPAWPTVEGNRFERALLALSLSGFSTNARLLDDRLRGNSFVDCERIAAIASPDTGGGAGEFKGSGATATDRAGNLHAIDEAGEVTRWSAAGEVLHRCTIAPAAGASAVDAASLAVNDTGELYLVDRASVRIRKFDPAGREILSFGPLVKNGAGDPALPMPSGIAVLSTATSETLLVTDAQRMTLVRLSNTGDFLEEIGGLGSALGKFDAPGGISPTADAKFAWLADANNDRLVKVEMDAETLAPDVPTFRIDPFVLDASGNWTTGEVTTERLPVKLVITALDENGNRDAGYAPASGLALSIDPVPAPVLWTGATVATVTDASATEADNGGTLKPAAFSSGVATVYVASFAAVSERCVTVSDPGPTPRLGTARCRWTAASRQAGEKLVVDLDGTGPGTVTMDFRWIPQGTFLMGSPDSETARNSDEGPQHQVILTKGFWLAETECTQEQWIAVMGANPSLHKSPFAPDDLRRPVEMVSWNDVASSGGFTNEMNARALGHGVFRLPTEAEWEYAARAGTESAFYWGSTWNGDFTWLLANASGLPHTVGTKSPNAWNLYDMSGNVFEWCSDWYDASYPDQCRTDPSGPVAGAEKVLRGGSYNYIHWLHRSSYRNIHSGPTYRYGANGFRAVIEP